jgi:hypothetical protein
MLSSAAGVLVLRDVEKQLGIAARLAGCLLDRRDGERIDHTIEEMLRLRMFAIAAGYEDANDCTTLRHHPVFKMAVGRVPQTGDPLCSQPALSRSENAPSRAELARLMAAIIDQFCASYRRHHLRSCSTSTTRSMRFMATSNYRCLTCTMTSAASCRSTSTKDRLASRWP